MKNGKPENVTSTPRPTERTRQNLFTEIGVLYQHFYDGVKKYLLDSTRVNAIVNGLSSFLGVGSGQVIIVATKSSLGRNGARLSGLAMEWRGRRPKLISTFGMMPPTVTSFFCPESIAVKRSSANAARTPLRLVFSSHISSSEQVKASALRNRGLWSKKGSVITVSKSTNTALSEKTLTIDIH